jgi:uncharacterized protein DUF3515
VSDPRPSRAGTAVGVVLAGLLVAGVITLGLVYGSSDDPPERTGPVAVVPVPAPAATSEDCVRLAKDLPGTLPSGDRRLERATLAEPAPAGAVAWTDRRSDPVVLRCGLEKPAELTSTTNLRFLSGVAWLPVEGTGKTTWYAVDRPVYVAMTVPTDAGTGPLQDISAAITRALSPTPIRTGG